jgi:hypothetical protein
MLRICEKVRGSQLIELCKLGCCFGNDLGSGQSIDKRLFFVQLADFHLNASGSGLFTD